MYECFVYIRSYNALTLPALCDEFIHKGTIQQLNALNHI